MQFEHAGRFILGKLSNELPKHLTYHSVEHTRDVYNSAELLGRQENVSPYELKLLLTAAWFHDAGFLKGPKDHEETSCHIAREVLPDFDYTPAEIERICGMIMATKLPQTPGNHLEEILADADLDYLGRDDFFITGEKLFDELLVLGMLTTRMQWNILQVKFLESHHYFTKTAIALRQPKKQEHLEQIKFIK